MNEEGIAELARRLREQEELGLELAWKSHAHEMLLRYLVSEVSKRDVAFREATILMIDHLRKEPERLPEDEYWQFAARREMFPYMAEILNAVHENILPSPKIG